MLLLQNLSVWPRSELLATGHMMLEGHTADCLLLLYSGGCACRVMGVALLLVLGSLATVRRYSFGLAGVWWTLVVFFFFRAANSCGRIFYLSKHAGSFLHRDNQMAMPRKEATQAI